MNDLDTFNVIIPMAGEGSRFGGTFKPFLKLDSRTFIEHVIDSFHDIDVKDYYFVIKKSQDIKYDVTNQVKKIFPTLHKKIKIIKLDRSTSGPFETLRQALLDIRHPLNNTLFCDCDHYVNTEPIVRLAKNEKPDFIVPTWDISNDKQENWGKIVISKQTSEVIKICEKEVIDLSEENEIFGMIGCYYIKNSDDILKSKNHSHFSSFLNLNYEKFKVRTSMISNAYFFGTPEMVKKTIEFRRTWETVFLDFDGVVVEHQNHSSDKFEENIFLTDSVNHINELRSQNKKIIITTARAKNTRVNFEIMLKQAGIKYDDLVMGLNPGPRYVINDIKPSNPHVNQAVAINLKRNAGLKQLNLEESQKYRYKIIKNFKGNSFSATALFCDTSNNSLFVRKHIFKNTLSNLHYEKLKRQLEDLKRFKYYEDNLTPKILRECDNLHEFYFDMEYMEEYKQLDSYPKSIQMDVLQKVISELSDKVYAYKKKNDSLNFVNQFFKTKIYPKLDTFENYSPVFDHLINSKSVSINNKEYFGIREILRKLKLDSYNTEYLNPIHGDLSLENILYDESSNKFVLIDMEGSRYVDSCYFDLAKIFQSVVSNYKEWNHRKDLVESLELNNLACVSDYFSCVEKDFKNLCITYGEIMENNNWLEVYKKGIFYMSMYFIRFVPFRMKISEKQGIFALTMAINWLNYLFKLNEVEINE